VPNLKKASPYYTVTAVARLLGVAEETVIAMLAAGRFPPPAWSGTGRRHNGHHPDRRPGAERRNRLPALRPAAYAGSR
jgi:hypothetical protein